MRHHVVRRLALALVALLTAAALVFAWRQGGTAARRDASPVDGASDAGGAGGAHPDAGALFARHCAGCHELDELARDLAAAPEPGAAVLALLELLDGHGATDAAEDRAVAWLLWRRAHEASPRLPSARQPAGR